MNTTLIAKVFRLILSILAGTILVVQVSDIFRLPVLLGISLNSVAAVTLVVTSLFIAANLRATKELFKSMAVKVIFFIKIIAPLALFPIHYLYGYVSISGFVRPMLLNILFFNLFLTAGIAFYKWKYSYLKACLGAILIIAFSGLAANYFFPKFFYGIKLAVWGVEKDLDLINLGEVQRTAGFYLKSTGASASLLLLYPSVVALFGRKLFWLAITYIVLLVGIFLTGARSGIAITALIIPFLLLAGMRYIKRNLSISVKNSINLGIVIVPFLLLLGGAFGGVLLDSAKTLNLTSLTDRVKSLTTASSLRNDESLNQRTTAQQRYLGFISRQPIWGYGPTYSKLMKERGRLWLSSHNSYIEETFDYGVFFLLSYGLLIVLLLLGTPVSIYSTYGYIDFMVLFGLVVMAYSFFASTLMENRSLFFSLGVIIGLYQRKKLSQKGLPVG